MKEVWKIYRDTKYTPTGKISKISKFEVSNFGRIKKDGVILEPHELKLDKGYYMFNCNGHIRVHRAVAELFIPNTENKPEVDHIDTNKLNNRVDNLHWVTRLENMNNPITIEHYKESFKGEGNPMFGKNFSEETKQKMREAAKNRTGNNTKGNIIINNGIREKRIFPNELNEYINMGWVKGRKIFNKSA